MYEFFSLRQSCVWIFSLRQSCVCIFSMRLSCIGIFSLRQSSVWIFSLRQPCIGMFSLRQSCIRISSLRQSCIGLFSLRQSCVWIFVVVVYLIGSSTNIRYPFLVGRTYIFGLTSRCRSFFFTPGLAKVFTSKGNGLCSILYIPGFSVNIFTKLYYFDDDSSTKMTTNTWSSFNIRTNQDDHQCRT